MDSIEGDDNADTSTNDYKQILNEWFPYYLALGMTYEQYWHGDPYLTVYYQKAKKMKFDYDNQMAWINGLYIYDAVSAIVFNTWCRKEGEQCRNYASKPYEFDEAKQEEEIKKEAEVQAEAWMRNFVNFYKV